MMHLLLAHPFTHLPDMFTQIAVSIFLLACLISPLLAEPVKPYAKGQTVLAFKAKDQHGNPYVFKKGTRYLLIAFDMSTSKMANKILAEKGKNYLNQNKAVYMADIHGMPKIGRAFALPKMRRYPHTIILADEKNLLSRFPSAENQLTVLKLNPQGKIISLDYWDPRKEKIEKLISPSKPK